MSNHDSAKEFEKLSRRPKPSPDIVAAMSREEIAHGLRQMGFDPDDPLADRIRVLIPTKSRTIQSFLRRKMNDEMESVSVMFGGVSRYIGKEFHKLMSEGDEGIYLLLALVTATPFGLMLLFSPFWAFTGIPFMWPAGIALRLARNSDVEFGWTRIAPTAFKLALSLTIVGTICGIIYTPRYLKNRRIHQIEVTHATMSQIVDFLEDHKTEYGSYPSNAYSLYEAMNQPRPTDFWGNSVKYESYTEAIADTELKPGGIVQNRYQLRSAGPDEKLFTLDDIVMRDGVFVDTEK